MTTRRAVVVFGCFVCSMATVLAQLPTPTPALDRRGKPLPFGVQPYFLPDVPLGSGPYRAIMSQEPGLPEQVAYFPSDLAALGAKKLPIVTWGNGSCMYAGNRFRQYLTEIASHGYLVIAGGPLADKELEVGPQENPAARQGGPGSSPATSPAPDPANPPGRVTVATLRQGIDWALQQNGDSGSRFYKKLDTQHIIAMGQSCGGGLAVQQAVEDARVTALGVWNSGAGLGARANAATVPLDNIKGPVLIVTGSEKLDIAFASGKSTFERINAVPVFYAWRDDLQHIGTYGAANGGELGQIAWKWLEWTTRGDQAAAKMFKGAACGLCKDPAWHVTKKKIDGQDRSSANARILEAGAAVSDRDNRGSTLAGETPGPTL